MGTIVFFSPLITHYIESAAFRVGMEKETAKGLHFPTGHYSAIRRTSPFTAQAESFEASNGQRALKSVDARGITARFDPWGVLIRQWRFSEIHVGSGEVEIQIYQANPEETPSKSWFALFLPNRVYLKRIEAERAIDFAVSKRCPVFEGAVVVPLNIDRGGIARPPMSEAGRRS